MMPKFVDQLPDHLVIAHRGTTYWAPEETEAAMRWARNTGADYLELDLQRTADGKLIALHDDNLLRTSNIERVFPERKNDPVSAFTYEELLQLDAGSWFNELYPDRARESYKGLEILLLKDVLKIAEGFRIKRGEGGKRIINKGAKGELIMAYEKDEADNGHRPGIYLETKIPALFPGIEEELRDELEKHGWYKPEPESLNEIETTKGKVAVGNTRYRVILQTFSRESLRELNRHFTRYVPKCFLLWRGQGADDLPDDSHETFQSWLAYGRENGATIIGPSIAGEPNNYPELTSEYHSKIAREHAYKVHAYSFDTIKQMELYLGDKESVGIDGVFTNRAEESLLYYKNFFGKEVGEVPEPISCLNDLGY